MCSSNRNNLGRVVIDYLTLTYRTDEVFMTSLAEGNYEFVRSQFCFVRTKVHGFEYAYNLSTPSDTLPICVIKFNSPSNQWDNYIHISVSNHVFYDAQQLERAVFVGDSLGLKYLGTARIDLAIDKSNNLLTLIRKQIRQEDTVPIVNNRCVWDRNEVIKNCFVIGQLTRTRTKIKSLYVHNSNKSLILKCYDKLAEINDVRASTEDDEYKQYIIDYYGNPRQSLHRLEVSATNKFLYDFSVRITPELILDQEFLQVLYYELVGRLLSFSTVGVSKGVCRSRKPIEWSTLLGLPGNNNNITYYANNKIGEWDMSEDWWERICVTTGCDKVLTENLDGSQLKLEVQEGRDEPLVACDVTQDGSVDDPWKEVYEELARETEAIRNAEIRGGSDKVLTENLDRTSVWDRSDGDPLKEVFEELMRENENAMNVRVQSGSAHDLVREAFEELERQDEIYRRRQHDVPDKVLIENLDEDSSRKKLQDRQLPDCSPCPSGMGGYPEPQPFSFSRWYVDLP